MSLSFRLSFSAISIASLAHASALAADTSTLNGDDFELVDRCARAAAIAVKAAEVAPTDETRRMNFMVTVQAEMQRTNQLGKQTPTLQEVLIADVSDLIKADGSHIANQQARDLLMARSAGLCSLFEAKAKTRR